MPTPSKSHMILGNLVSREGQVGKAITVHQALLQRSRLEARTRMRVLLCLGLDYKRGGFVDRALGSVHRSAAPRSETRIRADEPPEAPRKIAASVARGLTTRASGSPSSPPVTRSRQSQSILAFLENEIGLEALRRKDYKEATRRF